jgi:hypothetical protein
MEPGARRSVLDLFESPADDPIMTTPDPGTFFREMLGQWEGVANQFGAELMKSGEFARTMQGATALSLKAQEGAREAMTRALAAANMPSREEVIDLGGRMSAVEARLERIEALLSALAGAPAVPKVDRPKPSRTKKPPKKAG